MSETLPRVTYTDIYNGSPIVIPTGYRRKGDYIYIRGSNKSTMLSPALSGQEVCVLVTLVDGIVLARSLHNHSANYRTVVLYGVLEKVVDLDEQRASFKAYTDQVLNGIYEVIREPNDKELATTTVMRIPLTEAVAKMRAGPVIDFDKDLDRDCWAGVLLIKQIISETIRNPRGDQTAKLTDYVKNYEILPSKDRQETDSSADKQAITHLLCVDAVFALSRRRVMSGKGPTNSCGWPGWNASALGIVVPARGSRKVTE